MSALYGVNRAFQAETTKLLWDYCATLAQARREAIFFCLLFFWRTATHC
jgi:hypothetical protein